MVLLIYISSSTTYWLFFKNLEPVSGHNIPVESYYNWKMLIVKILTSSKYKINKELEINTKMEKLLS